MSPQLRVLAFCIALLVAPFLWSLGARLGGEVGGVLLPAAVVAAAAAYAQAGQPKPPAGARPA